MRLLAQSQSAWQYQLSCVEALGLRSLIKLFPLTATTYAKITKTDSDPKAAEREKLLNESLAEHREDLRRKAEHLVGGDSLKIRDERYMLTLGLDDREILLQILNDIRVESWRALGQPDDLDLPAHPSASELTQHNLMNLAGYFECELLNLQEPGDPATEH